MTMTCVMFGRAIEGGWVYRHEFFFTEEEAVQYKRKEEIKHREENDNDTYDDRFRWNLIRHVPLGEDV